MKFKKGITFILGLLLLMLAACTPTEKSESQLHEKKQITDDEEMVLSFEHPQTKQKYKIIHANQLFYPYMEKLKENPNLSSSETLDLYNKEVIQPIYQDCFENGEYYHMAETLLTTVPTGLTEIQVVSEKMETHKAEINQLIQESLLKSADLLPSQSDVAVCVFPSATNNRIPFAVGAGKI
ncbi:Zn-dependent protease, partial [Lysinibacillus capsici]